MYGCCVNCPCLRRWFMGMVVARRDDPWSRPRERSDGRKMSCRWQVILSDGSEWVKVEWRVRNGVNIGLHALWSEGFTPETEWTGKPICISLVEICCWLIIGVVVVFSQGEIPTRPGEYKEPIKPGAVERHLVTLPIRFYWEGTSQVIPSDTVDVFTEVIRITFHSWVIIMKSME